jgi:hypothetical protein
MQSSCACNEDGDAVKSIFNVSKSSMALSLMRNLAIDSTLGAVSGGLFGLVFGGFEALLRGESWTLVSIAIYFALCGGVAGAVMGACSTILNRGAKAPDSTADLPNADVERGNIAAIRHLAVSSQRRSQTGLPTASAPDRRRPLVGVFNRPLSC